VPEQKPGANDTITLMVMEGPTGNIRRVSVRKSWLRKVAGAVAVALCVAIGLSVDYVRVRVQVAELEDLRLETSEQREHIQQYSGHVEELAQRLARVDQLERKLRVITNLDPADPLPLPGIGGQDGDDLGPEAAWLTRAQRHKRIVEGFGALTGAADVQTGSLEKLLAHLEENSARLLHTPSISPTKGWLTSTFGYRTSPFTNTREFHRGIDIAGRSGTPVYATANGTVRFAGNRRALGKAIVLRHGYGVETKYGHLKEVLVAEGDKVKRGQKIGLMGSTGRSTGPHLHYQIEVERKPVNPGNYILEEE
jgi:murein DD-endopeptidase MepM/ murein hydrolase activator NlpD